MSETVGIVDLGSNSMRLSVVRVTDESTYRMLAEAKAIVRLAAAIDASGSITSVGREHTLRTLTDFRRMCRSYGVQTYLGVATAAVRQAEGGAAFLQEISDAVGIPLRIISDGEEAQLSFLGALNSLPTTDGLFIDVGGASTELVRFADRRLVAWSSLPYGALNLTNRFMPGGHGTPDAYSRMQRFLNELFATVPWLHSLAGLSLIGVGGTVRSVARMIKKASGHPLDLLHHYEVPPHEVEKAYRLLKSSPVDERAEIPGIAGHRAENIAAGAAIVWRCMAGSGTNRMVISGAGLREGLLHQYLLGPGELRPMNDVLAHSIANLVFNWNLGAERSRATAKLALSLFDGLEPIHQLPPFARRCLLAAASLAEIGQVVNVWGEEQHAFYLITRSHLFGLNHRELILTGAAAGYRSAGKAKAQMAPFRAILEPGDEEIARRLGVIVTMAHEMTRYEPDGIDELGITTETETVRLRLKTSHGAATEARNLSACAGEFRKAFRLHLAIES